MNRMPESAELVEVRGADVGRAVRREVGPAEVVTEDDQQIGLAGRPAAVGGLMLGLLVGVGRCPGRGQCAGAGRGAQQAAESASGEGGTRSHGESFPRGFHHGIFLLNYSTIGRRGGRGGWLVSTAITEFRIEVPQADLDDLHHRLARTRWPDREPAADRSQGVPTQALVELCRAWRDEYDWRATETRLNRIPQFRTEIEGVPIHFLHLRSSSPDAVPVVLTHGGPAPSSSSSASPRC